MASASSLAANAKVSGDEPPPLICAPCYICLEDGPDEKGQPLIRACSCRGESSAGYHLSCIVNYAKAKTKEAVEDYEAGGEDWDYVDEHWLKCVNCKQEYEDFLCVELAKEMVAYVSSLVSDPETHHLQYEARKYMLAHLSGIPEHAKKAQQEIQLLLSLWEERKSDFCRRWKRREDVDETDQTICHMDQKDELLMLIATTQLCQDQKEEALETWEKLLVTRKTLKSLIAMKDDDCNYIDSKIDEITIKIQDLKGLMGLQERNGDYGDYLRNQMAESLRKKNFFEVNNYKRYLAEDLLSQEPPEYEEAIGLLDEASDGLERILGPSHRNVAEVKQTLAEAKEKYKKHLASNDTSNGRHAGGKRRRDDEN